MNGNPLFDITALSHVEVVVKDGVVYKGGAARVRDGGQSRHSVGVCRRRRGGAAAAAGAEDLVHPAGHERRNLRVHRPMRRLSRHRNERRAPTATR